MELPAEIIELIAGHLPNDEQYKCLTLSKLWFESVHRAMYKVIRINNRHQFRRFFQIIQTKGHLVRQLYLSNSESANKKVVGITSLELDQLATYCPYMVILEFDQKVWKYSKLPPSTATWHDMRRLPAFNMDTMPSLSHMNYTKLTQLSLQGELVSTLCGQQQSALIRLLTNIPHLQHLCLNSKQNKSHVIHMSLQDMESIHTAAPHLTDLELSGSFKFTMDYTSLSDTLDCMQYIAQTRIRYLKLKATIPPQWIYYMVRKYPDLLELDLEVLDSAMTAFHTTTTSYKKNASSSSSHQHQLQSIPSAKEVQVLFSMLLQCCPRLRKMQIDSVTGKMYMTEAFFDTLATHKNLKEIKMKHSTYNLVSRNQFFDLLAARGRHVITGLGTEVLGTDIHIANIVDPLSHFTKLTELVLCCGHPYFDCDISVVLSGCQQLLDLTIRSAHLMLLPESENYPAKKQHPLKSLHLSTVSFSVHVFSYLGQTCHALKQLSFYECDQRDDAANQIHIHMPHNDFDLVLMNGIRLDSVPLQCHTWLPNARILAIETAKNNISKRWYHAYNGNNCYHETPKIQRLNRRKSAIAEHYYQYGWINNQKYLQKAISKKASKMQQQQSQGYLYSRTSREWEQDLFFGSISIRCKSIKKWELICNTTYHEF
ncbi:hypothetical protein MAM1_0277c09135 [Mucor ambiguus]|uniref:F-box domain-containing protein n=1 Tax=Mucor ambiguus TaxID=91626 RepID=A0A0C9LX39_9FUNG|nr:hypothetical protein MAM1_0277c09135 [Mucor ambiguus]